ncbi:hypothetical protein, partial [Klebsiella pneumoniae]|uniref:hypothetical protein n=2 Tax=Klebsiella pneumoniae TaxID=573 RepID=UPI001C83E7AB
IPSLTSCNDTELTLRVSFRPQPEPTPKNRACAFLAGFRVVCCLFCRFPVRNALRASQAVLITDVMVNVKNISLDKKAFKKNNTATTNFDGPELCT